MWCPSLRLLSSIVGVLNIFASFGFTIFIITLLNLHCKNFSNGEFVDSERVALIILMLLLLAWISFSIMLMIGIYQARYCLMASWIYFQFICIGFMVFTITVDVVQPVVKKILFTEVKFDFTLDSVITVQCVITGAIALCLLPVFLLYKSLRRSPQQLASYG